MRINVLSVSVLWILLLGVAAVASAQDQPGCHSVDNIDGPKIALCAVKQITSADTLLLNYEPDVEFDLISILDNLFEKSPVAQVKCEERWPNTDRRDHPTEYMKAVNGHDVLMEYWGTVTKASDPTGKPYLVQFCAMLVPVSCSEDSLSGFDFHRLLIPVDTTQNLKAVVMELAFGLEFEVYCRIAQGMRAFSNEDFNLAKENFTKARQRWESAMEEQTLPQMIPSADKVKDYLIELEDRIIAVTGSDTSQTSPVPEIDELMADYIGGSP